MAVAADLPLFLQGIAPGLSRVEQGLVTGFGSYDRLLLEAGCHLLEAGGKRLRPSLVLLWARALGGMIPAHEVLAGALEILHTATLIHDDVIDRAPMRRGLPAVHARWDDRVSVIAGDFLLAHASLQITTVGLNDLTALCARTVKEICEGEILQHQGRYDLTLAMERYQRQIACKTGALLACGGEGAAMISGASPEIRAAARRFGLALGACFQIVDDVLDFEGDESTLSKPIGNDLSQGFLTAPVLVALADPQRGAAVREAISAGFDDPRQLEAAVALMRDGGAIDLACRLAEEAAAEARRCLMVLPAGPAQDDLDALVGHVLRRDR